MKEKKIEDDEGGRNKVWENEVEHGQEQDEDDARKSCRQEMAVRYSDYVINKKKKRLYG